MLSNSINITQSFINYLEKKVNKVEKLDSKKTIKEKQKYIALIRKKIMLFQHAEKIKKSYLHSKMFGDDYKQKKAQQETRTNYQIFFGKKSRADQFQIDIKNFNKIIKDSHSDGIINKIISEFLHN